MQVKVIKAFRDKQTRALHALGEVFECDEDRVAEILAAGPYVEPIDEAAAPDELERLGMAALRKRAAAMKLDVSGLTEKADIIAAIRVTKADEEPGKKEPE